MHNPSAFFRRDVFEEVGLLDEQLQLAMDDEFFWRLLTLGVPMKHIPSFWGAFRQHGASKWAATSRGENSELWQTEFSKIYQGSRFPQWRLPRWLFRTGALALKGGYLLLEDGLEPIVHKLTRVASGAGSVGYPVAL